MKFCYKCNNNKEVSDFSKNKNTSDGLCRICKSCDRKRCKLYYMKNSENIVNQKKEYATLNSDSIKVYQKSYRSKNSSDIKDYRESNSDYYKEWWSLNREKAKKYDKRYREKYPHVKACRNMLRSCIDRIGGEKTQTSLELLKYTPDDLRVHIESLFKDGMSWDNHGEWHIDHIIPVSKFDPNTPLHIINSLSNLQPMWANENLSKSNKI